MYRNASQELLVGQVAVLGAVSAWLIIATIASAPVASTHSIIGAIIGFSVFMKGWKGIHWEMIVEIVVSWLVSPVLSGLTSIILYMIVDFTVLRRKEPLKCGFRVLPIFYFFVIAFLTFTVTFQGSELLGLNHIPPWLVISISIICGLISSIIVQFVVKPRLIKWIINRENPSINLSVVGDSNMNKTPATSTSKSSYHTQPKFEKSARGVAKWFFPAKERHEDAETIRMFSALQVFTACFGAFAYGANDISHVISSLAVLMSIYHEMNVDQKEQTAFYLYIYGSLAIAVGLWCLGHKVIKTIGKKMTLLDPCSGFTIEFGMALTVLLASKAGIPVSTTQCIVGSVAGVGLVKSGEGLNWKTLLYTVISWVVTLPASGILAAGIMFILNYFFL
uniref:Phosphate transporter n=1 Tax=Acrobeloides nanus TaxID=290746 RepID=A0A914E6I6_9BILA